MFNNIQITPQNNFEFPKSKAINFGKCSKIPVSLKSTEKFLNDNFTANCISKHEYSEAECLAIIASCQRAKAKILKQLNGYKGKENFVAWLKRFTETNKLYCGVRRITNAPKSKLRINIKRKIDMYDSRINDEMRTNFYLREIEGKFPIVIRSKKGKTIVEPFYDRYFFREGQKRNIYTEFKITEVVNAHK